MVSRTSPPHQSISAPVTDITPLIISPLAVNVARKARASTPTNTLLSTGVSFASAYAVGEVARRSRDLGGSPIPPARAQAFVRPLPRNLSAKLAGVGERPRPRHHTCRKKCRSLEDASDRQSWTAGAFTLVAKWTLPGIQGRPKARPPSAPRPGK